MQADLLFRRATIVDGTGAPAHVADLAVRGDRIFAAGDLSGMSAAREIDASGKVLCPGFVDIHGHSDYYILALPGADGKLLQGVTTEVGGNCGYSAAPVAGALAKDRAETHKELYGIEIDFSDFAGFLDRVESARPAVNYAGLVGFNTARASAGCFGETCPQEALDRIKGMVVESLEAGAFGMSMGLVYAPACFASGDEIVEVARQVGARGALVASHIRSEGEGLIEAIEESIDIAERAGVRFQISHLKTAGLHNWGKLARVLSLIENARSRGLEVNADRYPYLASFTQLSAALPSWVYEGGKDAFFARLADPAARERMRQELKKIHRDDDYFDRIMISQVLSKGLEHYEGRSVRASAEAENMDPVDLICRLVIDCRDRASATYHTMSKGNLETIYKKEWVMVGSDAAIRAQSGFLAEGKPHPRAFGTMPRMLAWVVRELGWLDLPVGVRKMTFDPCSVLGINDRGRVAEGLFADLVLFDPDTVRDTATYDLPQSYPLGIDMVVVNGKVAAEAGALTGERAGRVLRRAS